MLVTSKVTHDPVNRLSRSLNAFVSVHGPRGIRDGHALANGRVHRCAGERFGKRGRVLQEHALARQGRARFGALYGCVYIRFYGRMSALLRICV